MPEGIWINDPQTGEPFFVTYDEIDPDLFPQLLKPVGGFVYPAGDFTRLPLPEVPFYVKHWLPKQGKAEIYGRAKAGKSFLAIQLARAIASGEPFIDLPTTQARVLYLQFELGVEILQARLKMTHKDYENVYVGTSFSLKLDKLDGQKRLHDTLFAVEPRVLILDPLIKLISGDENEAQDMLKITDFLDECIDAHNLSVVLFHHAGKDLERGGRGSSVLEGWVDSCIQIKRLSKLNEPLKSQLTPQLLRHSELPPAPFTLILGDDFEFRPEDAHNASVLERVSDELKERGTCPAKDLIGECGSRKAVYQALNILQDKGMIDKSGLEYKWIGDAKTESKRSD